MTNPADQVMRVHIEYEDYLNARDPGDLLVRLDEIYDKLFYSSYPLYRELPGAEASRLRLSAVHGGSIVLELAAGITQVVESVDPALRTTIAGLPVLASLVKMTKDAADWALDYRGRLRTQAFEARSRDLELAGHELDLEERRRQLRGPMAAEVRQLSASQTSSHAEPTALPARREAELDEIGDAIGLDRARLEQVIVRSNITAMTADLVGEGDPG